jgi:signal transduction histidine kinase
MNNFLEDREGHLWIGTESGLCQLREQAVTVYAREQGLRNDFVKTATQSADGTIWLGTAAGASGIKDGQVTNLPPVEPSNWGRPEGLLADTHGRIWYGAQAHTLAVFNGGRWLVPSPLGLGTSWVRTLYEDRLGRIWGGYDKGVAWLDEEGSVRELQLALSHPDVRTIHQDRRGDFWFGTYGGGLNRLRDGQITVYTNALGEQNNRAWCIHEDVDGVFWVGSRAGLNRFVPPGVAGPDCATDGPREQGRTAQQDRNAAEQRDSSASKQSKNAPLVPAERFFTFTTRQGLYEDVINNVQEDDFGYLWLSGMQGIYRVSRSELNEVAAGRRAQAHVLAFGETDGMLNSQCNGGAIQPSGCKDASGRIWFPTARGVAMVDPRTIRRNEVPPPVVIEQVIANDQVVFGDGMPPSTTACASPPKPLRLAPGSGHVLEIHYTGNSLAAPNRMRFKYRLDGYDTNWRVDESNRRVAFYTSLQPGHYTFQVSACNNHGVWNEKPVTLAFTLAPLFWQTRWFQIGCIGLLVGAAAAIQAYRFGWQKRLLKLRHWQAMADERTRIARDLHDDLGTALTGVALQLDLLRRRPLEDPAVLHNRLGESTARIRSLAERMREVVWAVNPRCDTVSSLASFLEQQTNHIFSADGLPCRFDFPEEIPPLPLASASRHQLALAVREALTNAVRHSAAAEIILGLRVEGAELVMRVADDGRGFHLEKGLAQGRGLSNMQARLERIGGKCEIRSAPGAGTVVEFRLRIAPATSGQLQS